MSLIIPCNNIKFWVLCYYILQFLKHGKSEFWVTYRSNSIVANNRSVYCNIKRSLIPVKKGHGLKNSSKIMRVVATLLLSRYYSTNIVVGRYVKTAADILVSSLHRKSSTWGVWAKQSNIEHLFLFACS